MDRDEKRKASQRTWPPNPSIDRAALEALSKNIRRKVDDLALAQLGRESVQRAYDALSGHPSFAKRFVRMFDRTFNEVETALCSAGRAVYGACQELGCLIDRVREYLRQVDEGRAVIEPAGDAIAKYSDAFEASSSSAIYRMAGDATPPDDVARAMVMYGTLLAVAIEETLRAARKDRSRGFEQRQE